MFPPLPRALTLGVLLMAMSLIPAQVLGKYDLNTMRDGIITCSFPENGKITEYFYSVKNGVVYWEYSGKSYLISQPPRVINPKILTQAESCAEEVAAFKKATLKPQGATAPAPATAPPSTASASASGSTTGGAADNTSTAADPQPSTAQSIKNITPLPGISLENPLTGTFGATSLVAFFTDSIPKALLFFLGIVVMLVFLVSAVRYLFAAGSDDTKLAVKGMTYAALGAFVVVLGYAIIALVKALVT